MILNPFSKIHREDIEEHSPIGQHVVKVSADDIDTDAKDSVITYYIDNYSSLFTIKAMTGNTRAHIHVTHITFVLTYSI